MCVCVCVCVCEREREREREKDDKCIGNMSVIMLSMASALTFCLSQLCVDKHVNSFNFVSLLCHSGSVFGHTL